MHGRDLRQPGGGIWHHGTPQTGLPLEPPAAAAAAAHARGVRVIADGRPECGSTALPGRDVASAATGSRF